VLPYKQDLRFRVLPQQLHRLRYTIVSPIHFVGVHLGVYESRVVRCSYITISDSCNAGWTTFELTFAQLLRCGIDHLPASVQNVQIGSSHPNLVPHMIVPAIRGIRYCIRKTCVINLPIDFCYITYLYNKYLPN